MDVKLPDGTLLTNVPEGMSQEDILGHLQLAKHPSAQALMKQMAAQQTADETSPGGRFLAGQGLGFANLGRAARQMVGMGQPNETREIDRALVRTPSGFAGNLTTGIATAAPLSVVPGANTISGAAAVGGAMGAFQPADSTKERLINMGVGGVLGGGTQAAATVGAKKLGEWGASRQARAAELKAQNSVRDATLNEGRQAGFTVPPSAVNDSWLNKRLESIAGKAAVGQEASLRNQQVSDDLARRAAGLGPSEAISESTLGASVGRASTPYREVASLDPTAATNLEAWRKANLESKLQWKHYGTTHNPDAYRAAKTAGDEAVMFLDDIDQIAQGRGRPDLAQSLKEARVKLAKIGEVENAANIGTGSIDPAVIGRALDRGAPLSGELRTIGAFQQAFPQYMREASRIGTPGVSKSEALASAVLGTAGAAATGSPMGLLTGGLPLLSGPARSLVLSKPYQNVMAKPNYSAGMTANAVAPLANDETRRRLALMARSLALPAVPLATPSN